MIFGYSASGDRNPIGFHHNKVGAILFGATAGASSFGDIRGLRADYPPQSPDIAVLTLDVNEAVPGVIRSAGPGVAVPWFLNGVHAGSAATGTFRIGALATEAVLVNPLLSLPGQTDLIDIILPPDLDTKVTLTVSPGLTSEDIKEYRLYRGDGPGDFINWTSPIATLSRTEVFDRDARAPDNLEGGRPDYPTLVSLGEFSGATAEPTGYFVVEIDGAGELADATYRWRKATDSEWQAENQPCAEAYQALVGGVFVEFAGENFLVADVWEINWGPERIYADKTASTGSWAYGVKSVDVTGNVSDGGIAIVSITIPPPPPTELTAVDGGGGSVRLDWEFDAEDEDLIDGFVVFGNQGDAAEYPHTVWPIHYDGRLGMSSGRVAASARQFVVTGILAVPGLWRVAVQSYKGALLDGSVGYVEFRVSGGAIVQEPDAPVLVSATPLAGGDVQVVVRVNTDTVDSLNMYTDAGSGSVDYDDLIANVPVTGDGRATVVLTYDLADLTEGVVNRLAVRAKSAGGYEEDNAEYLEAIPDATPPGTPSLAAIGGL